MSDHQYKVMYHIEQGNFTAQQLRESERGGCDEVLLCSYVESENGSGSYAWLSSNGATPHQEMDPHRKLHCLAMLAKTLAEDPELGPGARQFCNDVFERFRQAVLQAKNPH